MSVERNATGRPDERLYAPPTDARAQRNLRLIARLSGRPADEPDVWTEDRKFAYWVEELNGRTRSDKDAVVVWTGPPGSGKSTGVLHFMRLYDPTFTPQTLAERVAFFPHEVPKLYKRTPRFGAAWVDEAASAGLLAYETNTPEQRRLIELIQFIRARNVVLFVVIPQLDELAKSFRARRADYRVECQEIVDGHAEAFVGRRVHQRQFFAVDSRWHGFMDGDDANPITWPDYRTSDDPVLRAYWDAYWPLKQRYMARRVDEIETEMDERAAAGGR